MRGVFRHSDSELWMCVPEPAFSVNLHNLHPCSYLHYCNSLQTSVPMSTLAHSLPIHSLPHRPWLPKTTHLIVLSPYLTWPQGPSWSDSASSPSTLPSMSLLYPHHFLWLAQFLPTATPTSKTSSKVGFYAWDVLIQPWFSSQISGQISVLQGRCPSPRVCQVPCYTFSWLPVLLLCSSSHSCSEVYFCDYMINV